MGYSTDKFPYENEYIYKRYPINKLVTVTKNTIFTQKFLEAIEEPDNQFLVEIIRPYLAYEAKNAYDLRFEKILFKDKPAIRYTYNYINNYDDDKSYEKISRGLLVVSNEYHILLNMEFPMYAEPNAIPYYIIFIESLEIP